MRKDTVQIPMTNGKTLIWAAIMAIIFWDFLMFFALMFFKFFLSPQVKQSVIICNKHDMYVLPHKLLNNLEN